VLQLASWWTLRNTFLVLTSVAGILLIVLIWAFLLQRRVNRQTATIATKLERESQLQAELARSQKLESVGRLAGGVAHDFNNLLTVINGYAELVLAQVGTSDAVRPALEQIRRAGERAAALTQQLLGFSRKQVIRPRPLNLNAAVSEALRSIERLLGESIRVVVSLEEGLGAVQADSSQIDQILLNLAANARDAMPRGGQLRIATRNVELRGNARPSAETPEGDYVRLSVSDTGVGIDKETQEHIFEPFFTTKEQGRGTGLGLATVYGIVKQNGGWIWVRSEAGQGASFEIYLPRLARGVVEEAAEAPKPVRGGSETVLVVEDEEDVRRLATTVLQAQGYAVLSASTAEQALERLDGYEGPLQLLVTDVILPAMDGRELADRILMQRPGLSVLFISGYTRDVISERGVLAPGIEYLAKPFSTTELAARVRSILGGVEHDEMS
jgi:signal transduction histidine kinase/CheY-like chemotaxis protein